MPYKRSPRGVGYHGAGGLVKFPITRWSLGLQRRHNGRSSNALTWPGFSRRINPLRWSWVAGMVRFWPGMPACTPGTISSGWNGCWGACATGSQRPARLLDEPARGAHRILLLSRIPAAGGLGGRPAHILSRPVAQAAASPASADQRTLSAAGPPGLAPGGTVYLRTDDEDYFGQMVTVFEASRDFRQVETPEELAGLLTDFEKDFQGRGVKTLRTAYQRGDA